MKVKSVDVARRLGISKATVSLAINNRPGVSEKTKKQVEDCIREMEAELENGTAPAQEKKTAASGTAASAILILVINSKKQLVYDPSFDLMTDVLQKFSEECQRIGYAFRISFMNEGEQNEEQAIENCNEEEIAAVVVFATEMDEKSYPLCQKIRKPLLLYDYKAPDSRYSSVCFDNAQAVRLALSHVLEQLGPEGGRNIKYLASSKTIMNFEERRNSFTFSMADAGIPVKKDDILHMGYTTQEMTDGIFAWLSENPRPDAFILENYHVSIAVLNALHKKGLQPGADILLAGVDELPEYLYDSEKISQVIMPHLERVRVCINLLKLILEGQQPVPCNVSVFPHLVPAGEKA